MAATIVRKRSDIPGQREEATEVEELNHSGTFEKGEHKYNKCPVKGGMLYNSSGILINARGQEIDETGKVLFPEKYKDDLSPWG